MSSSYMDSLLEDSDTNKDVQNIRIFQTLSEAEQYMVNGTIYKNNYKDFFTIRKIYF
jgi:hypothetical protein